MQAAMQSADLDRLMLSMFSEFSMACCWTNCILWQLDVAVYDNLT
jgi:hypothetical protein